MNKDPMKESAAKLSQPSESAFREFSEKSSELAVDVIRRLMSRPDIDRLVGPDNMEMMQNNIRNFTRFMESLFSEYNPEVFVETVRWAIRTYRAHGFSPAFWPANLDTFCIVIKERLSSGTFREIHPFYNWITVNLPKGLSLTDE